MLEKWQHCTVKYNFIFFKITGKVGKNIDMWCSCLSHKGCMLDLASTAGLFWAVV